MPKVSKENLEDVLEWLREHDFNCSSGKLHRTFSSGVAMAALLKQLHPNLIDLHNYPQQNSTRLKLTNWETLNTKVFSKLGLQQKQFVLESLATGNESAIEALLFSIMAIEREDQKKRKEAELANEETIDNVLSREDQVLQIMVNKKIGDAILQVPQQMVLYALYEKTIMEVEVKTEKFKCLEKKLFQVENEVEKLKTRSESLNQQEEIWANKERRYALNRSLANNSAQRSLKENGILKTKTTTTTSTLYNDDATPRAISIDSPRNTTTSNHNRLSLQEKQEREIGIENDEECNFHSISANGWKSIEEKLLHYNSNIHNNNNNNIKKHINNNDNNYNHSRNQNNKKDFKLTKIPTRNGQILKSIREKSARSDQESAKNLNNLRASKSDLLPRSSTTQKQYDVIPIGDSKHENERDKFDSNNIFQSDSLAAFRAENLKKLLNSVRSFPKKDCQLPTDKLFKYEHNQHQQQQQLQQQSQQYQRPQERYDLTSLLVDSINAMNANTDFKSSGDMKNLKSPKNNTSEKFVRDLLAYSQTTTTMATKSSAVAAVAAATETEIETITPRAVVKPGDERNYDVIKTPENSLRNNASSMKQKYSKDLNEKTHARKIAISDNDKK